MSCHGCERWPSKAKRYQLIRASLPRRPSDKIWLPEHVEAFLAVASPEMQLAMILALNTGQRQADLLSLPWSSYDGQSIVLIQGKGRRAVRVPCTMGLRNTLDTLERRSPIIFTTKTGRVFKKRYLAEQWEATCKAAEITDLHFHDVRGTMVTMLAEAGSTVPEIASIAGHTLRSAQEILDKYLSRTTRLAETAITKLENVIQTDFAKRPAKQVSENAAK